MYSLKKLWHDNRGIEGLPIRLVIALVVGVASLAIMTSILGGLPTFESTEVTIELDPSTVSGDETQITLSVVDDSGEPVDNSQIVFAGGTSNVNDGSPVVKKTGSDSNTVTISVGTSGGADVTADLRADQNMGTVKIHVRPPTDGNFVDDQANPEILVTK